MKNKLTIAAAASLLLVASSTIAPAFAMTMDKMPTAGTGMMTNMMINASLGMGAQGADVSSLQTFLVSKGFLTLPMGASMGYFGRMTKMALMKYQMSVGVAGTGFFGAMTRAKFNGDIGMTTNGNTNMGTNMGGNTNMNATTSAEVGVMVGGALMTPGRDIVENALNASTVTTLVAAVKAAGLVATLQSKGPFTVFAPTNDAFAKVPAATIASLLMPENKAQLIDILTYHVVAGRYTAANLYDGQVLTTVEGKTLKISKSANGTIMINGSATVQIPDVISRNGVTFVIDTVLLPPTTN